jgi:septal ring factor EnvC (AmiA/AmiB activator)
MTGFRGSDERLDREIATLEKIARLRVRRAAAELHELDRDLRELKRERARRRAVADEVVRAETSAPVTP